MGRVLTILEVSQKQAYIFSSNVLKDNIQRSAEIAWVTGSDYIDQTVGDRNIYCEKNNLVYAGGGHTILEFPDMETAKKAVSRITGQILKDFPEIEMFAKNLEYDESQTPNANVLELTAALERKKAVRAASFHQRTFGVEQIDTNTGKPCLANSSRVLVPEHKEALPQGYSYTYQFEDLGGSDSNFIAVVHIDGNAMGKRITDLVSVKEMQSWEGYKQQMKAFSKGIADDFEAAYQKMEEKIASEMKSEAFYDALGMKLKSGESLFPVRRIIQEGDDLCFVANGKIGLECAAAFLKALSLRENPVDHKTYAACAGIALVHQKYPFYRAYEMAEELCSNAKRFGAEFSADRTGSDLSCMDWHIEFGEMQDNLEETRKMYRTDDGKQLEMRPYIVVSPDHVKKEEPYRQYENFRTLIHKMNHEENFYARGLLKGIRPILKQGENAAWYYLTFHKADKIARDAYQGVYKQVEFDKFKAFDGKGLERAIFIKTADGKERSTLFDAIEISDSCILFGEDQA